MSATDTLARHDAIAESWRRYHAQQETWQLSAPTPPSTPKPAAPTVARPAPDAEEQARATIRDDAQATAARTRATRSLVQATEDLVRAEATMSAADQRARRAERLAAVTRSAPGALLRKQIEALPPMPSVRVEVAESQGADGTLSYSLAIMVLTAHGAWVDARVASRGEIVRAGAELRASLRAAAHAKLGRWGAVQIPIDDRQDWSGAIEIPTPYIEFVTTQDQP